MAAPNFIESSFRITLSPRCPLGYRLTDGVARNVFCNYGGKHVVNP